MEIKLHNERREKARPEICIFSSFRRKIIGKIFPYSRKRRNFTQQTFLEQVLITLQVPKCPGASTELYTGYSLFKTEGNLRSQRQDLGSSGSCVPHFSLNPFLFCDFRSQCRQAGRNQRSYWLTTHSTDPKLMLQPVKGQEIIKVTPRPDFKLSILNFFFQNFEVKISNFDLSEKLETSSSVEQTNWSFLKQQNH